jgi:hypothetical protein
MQVKHQQAPEPVLAKADSVLDEDTKWIKILVIMAIMSDCLTYR